MALDKIINSKVVTNVKKLAQNEKVVEILKEQFTTKLGIPQCPMKSELLKINNTKNQLVNSIGRVLEQVNKLDKFATDTEKMINNINGVVKTIKAIPIPTSVPPGIGIPVNVITVLADVLDFIGKMLDKGKGAVEAVKPAIKVIQETLNKFIADLNKLDGLIGNCLIEEVKRSLEWDPNTEYVPGNKVSRTLFLKSLTTNTENPLASDNWEVIPGPGVPLEEDTTAEWVFGQEYPELSVVKFVTYYTSLSDNITKTPEDTISVDWDGELPEIALAEAGAQMEEEINFEATKVGDSTNVDENIQSEVDLESSLTTPPGLYYAPYYLLLEYDPEQEIIPRRRIVATHEDDENDKLLNDFSFSATTQVLFNEMKFRIDTIDSNFDLSIIGEIPTFDEKEASRDAITPLVKAKYPSWTTEEINELFDKAWKVTTERGPGDSWYDNLADAAYENMTDIITEAMDAYVWLFRTERINLVAATMRRFNVSKEDAKIMNDLVDGFGNVPYTGASTMFEVIIDNWKGVPFNSYQYNTNINVPTYRTIAYFGTALQQGIQNDNIAYNSTYGSNNRWFQLTEDEDNPYYGTVNVRRQALIELALLLREETNVPSLGGHPFEGNRVQFAIDNKFIGHHPRYASNRWTSEDAANGFAGYANLGD